MSVSSGKKAALALGNSGGDKNIAITYDKNHWLSWLCLVAFNQTLSSPRSSSTLTCHKMTNYKQQAKGKPYAIRTVKKQEHTPADVATMNLSSSGFDTIWLSCILSVIATRTQCFLWEISHNQLFLPGHEAPIIVAILTLASELATAIEQSGKSVHWPHAM